MDIADKKDTRNMVLRTVFLPPTLDDKLRDIAFERRVSKGDLMRSLVTVGLKSLQSAPDIKELTRVSFKGNKNKSSLLATSKVAMTSKLPAQRVAHKKVTKKLVK